MHTNAAKRTSAQPMSWLPPAASSTSATVTSCPCHNYAPVNLTAATATSVYGSLLQPSAATAASNVNASLAGPLAGMPPLANEGLVAPVEWVAPCSTAALHGTTAVPASAAPPCASSEAGLGLPRTVPDQPHAAQVSSGFAGQQQQQDEGVQRRCNKQHFTDISSGSSTCAAEDLTLAHSAPPDVPASTAISIQAVPQAAVIGSTSACGISKSKRHPARVNFGPTSMVTIIGTDAATGAAPTAGHAAGSRFCIQPVTQQHTVPPTAGTARGHAQLATWHDARPGNSSSNISVVPAAQVHAAPRGAAASAVRPLQSVQQARARNAMGGAGSGALTVAMQAMSNSSRPQPSTWGSIASNHSQEAAAIPAAQEATGGICSHALGCVGPTGLAVNGRDRSTPAGSIPLHIRVRGCRGDAMLPVELTSAYTVRADCDGQTGATNSPAATANVAITVATADAASSDAATAGPDQASPWGSAGTGTKMSPTKQPRAAAKLASQQGLPPGASLLLMLSRACQNVDACHLSHTPDAGALGAAPQPAGADAGGKGTGQACYPLIKT